VRFGEVEVALVVRGHCHERAGSILHQHVVGDEHRNLLAVDGVGDGASERYTGLGAFLRTALFDRLANRLVDVRPDLLLVPGSRGQALDLGMLGREGEERGAEERVGARGEDGKVEVEVLAPEGDLGALGATDPVALHPDDVFGPALEQLEVGQQPVGVSGDLEEPLFEVSRLDQRPAALAAAVDHLLVGEHGLVDRAPLHLRLRAVGEAGLVQPQEDPLGPAVVRRIGGRDLAAPVDRHAPGLELAAKLGNRGDGRVARVLAGLDRVVLGGEAEGVVAHRVDDLEAVATAEVGDRVADRVDLQVADVGLARGVGQHLERVVLRHRVVEAGLAGVWHLPRAFLGPHRLPAALDRMGVVAVHAPEFMGVHRLTHGGSERAYIRRTPNCTCCFRR
jgi:hypothetical protein